MHVDAKYMFLLVGAAVLVGQVIAQRLALLPSRGITPAAIDLTDTHTGTQTDRRE